MRDHVWYDISTDNIFVTKFFPTIFTVVTIDKNTEVHILINDYIFARTGLFIYLGEL